MKKRQLGRTGLEVGELGMGGLFVASFAATLDEAKAAVRRALDLGVNYVDTAPNYGNSEEVLGMALEGIPPSSYLLSTKLGGRPKPFNPKDKDALRSSFEESLRLLKRDYIDLLMIHEPDRPGQYDWWTDYDRFQGPVADLLEQLKAEGLIRYTGLGGTTAYEIVPILNTGAYDVVLTAFNYSLLWREALIDVIPAAKKQNMGIIIGSPLQQGALARRYDDEVNHGARWLSSPRRAQYKALYAYLDEIHIPLPELSLRMILSNPDVCTVLMGARSVAEVEQNVRAVEAGPLPQEVLDRLQEIAERVPFRPFEEPFGLPFNRPCKGPGWAA